MANRLPGLKEGRCIGVILEWGHGCTSAQSPMSSISSTPPRFYVVIPCAGSGSRAGTALPKQYTLLEGLPLVIHTVKAFAQVAGLSQCLLVVAPDDVTLAGLLAQHNLGQWAVAPVGGATRAQSVLAGLRHLQAQGAHAADWVMVHDAARCLIEPASVASLMAACRADAVGGLLAQPLADTLKAERDVARAHLEETEQSLDLVLEVAYADGYTAGKRWAQRLKATGAREGA